MGKKWVTLETTEKYGAVQNFAKILRFWMVLELPNQYKKTVTGLKKFERGKYRPS